MQPSTLDQVEFLDSRQFQIVMRRLADNLSYGSDRSPFLGSGIEFAQSRQYEHGDPVRDLDWRGPRLVRAGEPVWTCRGGSPRGTSNITSLTRQDGPTQRFPASAEAPTLSPIGEFLPSSSTVYFVT